MNRLMQRIKTFKISNEYWLSRDQRKEINHMDYLKVSDIVSGLQVMKDTIDGLLNAMSIRPIVGEINRPAPVLIKKVRKSRTKKVKSILKSILIEATAKEAANEVNPVLDPISEVKDAKTSLKKKKFYDE